MHCLCSSRLGKLGFFLLMKLIRFDELLFILQIFLFIIIINVLN